jgi:hypothetical protein
MSDYHEGLEEGIKIGKAEAADRIAELEAVLERIIENEDQFRMAWAAEIARAALKGGKKDE